MPLFFQNDICENTKLAVWEITEQEDFFALPVPFSKHIAHPLKKLQHLAGRYLLPYLFTDFPNDEIEIADTRKPFLPNEQYHFSISHCKNYAAAIVSSSMRVGVDVEFITYKVEKIKHKFLHADEIRFVNSRPAHEQLLLLTLLWCAKEAIFKWYSKGEVDFSEMIRTFPFEIKKNGEMMAAFINPLLQQKLLLHYHIFEELVLVYVISEEKNKNIYNVK